MSLGLMLMFLSLLLMVLFCFIVKVHKANVKAGKTQKLNPLFKIVCGLGCIIDFVIVGFITNWSFSTGEAIGIIIALIVPGIFTQCLYFLPYLNANKKNHPQETAIFILNLFAGWTIIAWIIALVWSFTDTQQKVEAQAKIQFSYADELKKYKDLLDNGILTQEEFEAKKKELLEL